MPRGDKSKYTDKQKRQAEHIEEGYEERGVPEQEAERRAWATVNEMTGGGKKPGVQVAARRSTKLRRRRAARKVARLQPLDQRLKDPLLPGRARRPVHGAEARKSVCENNVLITFNTDDLFKGVLNAYQFSTILHHLINIFVSHRNFIYQRFGMPERYASHSFLQILHCKSTLRFRTRKSTARAMGGRVITKSIF